MGIDTFLTTLFWLYLFIVIFRACILTSAHPRKKEINIGEDTLALIIAIAFFVWICCLKFGV